MGMLVNGEWQDVWYDTKSSGGRFVREDARFRNWLTADGAPGENGEGGFAAEAGRYTCMFHWPAPGPTAP